MSELSYDAMLQQQSYALENLWCCARYLRCTPVIGHWAALLLFVKANHFGVRLGDIQPLCD